MNSQRLQQPQIPPTAAATELIRRRVARRSMLGFTKYTKPDYEANWHHELLCSYIDRFIAGEIQRLMVFMPPRHGKSEIVSRRLPAYLFGVHPCASIIACSYSADLASRMNRDVQRIMDSDEYRRTFPDTRLNTANVRTTSQENYLRNSDIFEIVDNTGVYRSAGVGGGITGMGCNYGIIDDPIKNREEALSTTYRNKVWEWYTTTFYTRLEKDAQILVTLTRWHEDDLAGRILAQAQAGGEQWTVISLPAVAEPDTHPDDPRSEGEALWPSRFNADRLAGIRTVLGPYQFSALYQQRPMPLAGGLWKYDDIVASRVTTFPNLRRIVVGVDPAVTGTATSDENGIIVAGEGDDSHFYIIADKSVRGIPSVWAQAVASAFHSHAADRVIVEVNNGGDLVEVNLRTVDRNIPIKSVRASRGKLIRAEPIASLYEQGKVHHVGVFPDLEDQMCSWVPGDKSPDRMDALVWALWELSTHQQSTVAIPADWIGFGGGVEEEEKW